MGKEKVKCEDCIWVDIFTPRQDEIERGQTMGCTKPDWEGYTRNDKPDCGGVFFSPKKQIGRAR